MARTSSSARKTHVKVSLRADLVRRANALRLDLADLLEHAIERAIVTAQRDSWQRDNAEAIDAYNDWVAKHGSFSVAWRKF